MTTRTISLTERESRVLHAIERCIAHWHDEVEGRNYSGRDESQRDLCVEALQHVQGIRDVLMDA
jgi:hypothetical protein